MHILQCSNGHFYDGDKYGTCPHCGAVPGNSAPQKKERSDSFFKRNKNKPVKEHQKTEGIFNNPAVGQKVEKTEMFFPEENPVTGPIPQEYTPVNAPAYQERNIESETYPKQLIVEKTLAESFHEEMRQPAQPVQAELQSEKTEMLPIEPANSGKTVGFFSAAISSANAAATPVATPVSSSSVPAVNVDPVVGWLVCIKGMYFGNAFIINAGRNSLGRDTSNRIAIIGDQTVSNLKHLWITYEPKKREFFVQPGESSGLVYLNGENIMTSQKMNAYDQLEIGAGTYMLVPLCCEQFSWEDYIKA